MAWKPGLASIRDAVLSNPQMMRRVWSKYPIVLDGFAAEAQRVLDGEWDTKEPLQRRELAMLMKVAKNPNLARLLECPDFPTLRDGLLDEDRPTPVDLPHDSSLLKALGVWVLRRDHELPGPRRVLDLARALRRNGQADLARRILLVRLWREGDCPAFFRRVRDELALCTSMASDLPPGPRLDEASGLLRVRPPSQTAKPRNKDGDFSKEAQGMRYRGWVFRRRWEFHHRRRDLKRASQLYQRAARLARQPLDRLTSAADAAFHLDLMADLDRQMGSKEDARQTRGRADTLRLAALREAVPDSSSVEPPPEIAEWPLQLYRWLHNVAQLQLGLARWAAEITKGEMEDRREVAEHLCWFDSMRSPMRQLVRARDISQLPAWIESRKVLEIAERSKVWQVKAGDAALVVRALLERGGGDRAAIGQSIAMGKVGLGLSGGGFRASLFHLGVLASLAERDLLRQLEVISCVSGGSIVGAQFYLELRRLLQTRQDSDITRDDYIELVRELIHEFLAGVQRNIRTRVLASPWANLRMLLTHYTRSARAGDLLGRYLFQQVEDEPGAGARRSPRLLSDLRVAPLETAERNQGFNPLLDNWRRKHKVPILLLNATSLNTGHNWQFGATWMGESPAAVDPDVDSNDRLRRMDIGHEAPPPHDSIRLGHAVAASACVPGLFEPSTLPGLYDKKLVRLVDGGVFDNQGIAGLLEQECRIVLVSDASGQMAAQDRPHGGFVGSTMRTNTILMDRVRQTQFRDLEARRRAGQLDGLSYVHLKQDLEADPVNWLGCDDPKPAAASDELPVYGIPKAAQELLAGIRTDLDSFCDAEAYALMYSGYRMMNAECERLSLNRADLVAAPPRRRRPLARRRRRATARKRPGGTAEIAVDWPFLCVEERMTDETAPGHARLAHILSVGHQGAFKIWRLWRRGRPLARWAAGGVALLPLAWLAWLYGSWLVRLAPGATLGVSQLTLGLVPLALLALLLVPPLRSALARLVRWVIFGQLGMVVAWIHLLVFDPLYLRHGREPAGFARRLLLEARKALDAHDSRAADRKIEKAQAILDRLLRPTGPGGAPTDSRWLSQVAEARALALQGDHQQAADRLTALAAEIGGAAEELEAAAGEPDAEHRAWLGERQETLLRRKTYIERLAAAAAVEGTVRTMAEAWSNQDERRYFSCYAESFRPKGELERAEWQELCRRQLADSSRSNYVHIADFEVLSIEPDRARARFRDRFEERMVTTLELVPEKTTATEGDEAVPTGKWKILIQDPAILDESAVEADKAA